MTTARHSNWRTQLSKLAARTCDAIDQALYARQLATARAHQAAIDEIAARPVRYSLTPLAEAVLEGEAETEAET